MDTNEYVNAEIEFVMVNSNDIICCSTTGGGSSQGFGHQEAPLFP
jgi:hypothetical protein